MSIVMPCIFIYYFYIVIVQNNGFLFDKDKPRSTKMSNGAINPGPDPVWLIIPAMQYF